MLRLRLLPPACAVGLLLAPLLSAPLLLAEPAAAVPVVLYGDKNEDFGFLPSDVEAAIAAGADVPTPASQLLAGSFFHITTPDGIVGTLGKNRKSPSTGTSTWTLHIAPNTPAEMLAGVSVVILGVDPNDPFKYKNKVTGLQIDTGLPWFLLEQSSVDPDFVAVAFLLGDLEAGESYDIPIEYRVAKKLKKQKQSGTAQTGEEEFIFPRYAFAINVSGEVVPEPSALTLLLGAALLGLAVRRSW
jgi:hypothetical protein